MIRWLHYIKENFSFCVILYTLTLYTKAVGFVPDIPGYISYIVMIFCAVYALANTDKIHKYFLILLLYIPFNIIIAAPDPLFNSWQRYILFLCLLMYVSPLLQSKINRYNRKKMLYFTLWISTFLSIGSFFCFFLGINFMKLTEDFELTQAGVFGGLFNHSMTLGPLAGLSTLFMTYKVLNTKEKIYLIAVIFCMGALLFSASRSAIISTLFSLIVLLYFRFNNKVFFFKSIATIILVSTLSFPLWEDATSLVLQKQQNNQSAGSTFDSRSSKWNNRIAEFSDSPITGVGFAAMDIRHRDDYNSSTGVMEPGSSWLGLLSMLGILGFSIVIVIFITALKGGIKSKDIDGSLLLGCLAFFCLHMIAEGYVISAGFFLCFLLWLIIGVCVDNFYSDKDTFFHFN